MQVWHSITAQEALRGLESASSGLTMKEAAIRLERDGRNELPKAPRETWFHLFFRQFASPLIAVLLVACVIVFWLGDYVDGFIIAGVLIFNALIGAVQEGKAQRSLEALSEFAKVVATVRRAGKDLQLPDEEVVRGDILVLREGERVPADARLLFSKGLQTDEAALTGESFPVRKMADSVLAAATPVADRRTMVYRGTYVLSGSGIAVVVATGSSTVLGGIAKAVVGRGTKVPLQESIEVLSRMIVVVVGFCLLLLGLLGYLRGLPLSETFIVGVSLAVSVIPEGLPIVMTIILATGVWRMAKRNVLVRKLPAVEALGRATIVALDKTGTITKNELMVRSVFVGGKRFEVTGLGYSTKGKVVGSGEELQLLGTIAAAGTTAEIVTSPEGRLKVVGDPTEAALGVFAAKLGVRKEEVKILETLPFSYQHRFQALELKYEGKMLVAVIGAPETVLRLCGKRLSAEEKKEIERQFLALSDEGLRVVACATGEMPEKLSYETVGNLEFLGMFGMNDTIRSEAQDAVLRSTKAGLKVVMITGDHARTAIAIAREVGIYREGDAILEGSAVEEMTPHQLANALTAVTVFARVTPEQKLQIIRAYRERGEVIAMTGDGVNDVPSIVAADLGVAMGTIGTEVTKSAADIVLLDDNFGSIVSGVEEGRHMYTALKKVTMYLLSTSIGEMLTILAALFLGMQLPILAGQIIWLNLVTDTFLDVALAMEPKGTRLLSAGSRPSGVLVDKPTFLRMLYMATPMAIGTLVLFGLYAGGEMTKAWTVSLTTLAVFQWFNVWNCRSATKSIFQMSPFSNRFLLAASFVVFGLQLLAIYHPFFQRILKTAPLLLADWILIVCVASSILVLEELRKLFVRTRKNPLG